MSESPLCPVCHKPFQSTDGFVYLGATRVLLHPACYSNGRWRTSEDAGRDALVVSVRDAARLVPQGAAGARRSAPGQVACSGART